MISFSRNKSYLQVKTKVDLKHLIFYSDIKGRTREKNLDLSNVKSIFESKLSNGLIEGYLLLNAVIFSRIKISPCRVLLNFLSINDWASLYFVHT